MKLKETREARGLNQSQLAKAIKTDVGMVSRYENYKCLPTPEKMRDITAVLDCQISDIYTTHEITFKVVRKRSKKTSKDKYHLSAYLPARARTKLHKMLELLGYANVTAWANAMFERTEQEYKVKVDLNRLEERNNA